MGFSAKQVHALRRNLDQRHVRTREANGRKLTYIEGWHAIAEANRIFGFDGWNRETVESRCVQARESRGTFLAVYIAKVRITVPAEHGVVIRDGHGTGEGRGTSPGGAHDIALKTAETDATKRALATFGKPFGLALYLGGKARLNATDPNQNHSNKKVSIVSTGSKHSISKPPEDLSARGQIEEEPLEHNDLQLTPAARGTSRQ